MISQLLNEPYIEFVPEIIYNDDSSESIKLSCFFLCLLLIDGQIKGFSYLYDGSLIKTQKEFEEVFKTYSIEEIENQLLEIIFWAKEKESKNTINWETLSLIEKTKYLKIPEYISNRNLNDLINYFRALKKMRG